MKKLEDRLQQLKKITDNAYPNIKFTAQDERVVQSAMHKEQLQRTILMLLHEPKTSSRIAQLLHAKNDELIRHNEGAIFKLLHELEQIGYVQASWPVDEQKTYQITKKGLKIISGEKEKAPFFSIQKLMSEVRSL